MLRFAMRSIGAFALTAHFWSLPVAAAPSPSKKMAIGRGAGAKNNGVGVSLGDPLGFTFKHFFSGNHAVQADFGWAPLHHGDGRLGADYLWHPVTFVSNEVLDFMPYLGVGLGMMFWAGHHGAFCRGRGHNIDCTDGYYRGGGAALFLRAPILGLALHWKDAPLDTVIEGSWSPYLVMPDLAHGDVSVKLRYWF